MENTSSLSRTVLTRFVQKRTLPGVTLVQLRILLILVDGDAL